MPKTAEKKKPLKIYKPPPSAMCAVTDGELNYLLQCPICMFCSVRYGYDYELSPKRRKEGRR